MSEFTEQEPQREPLDEARQLQLVDGIANIEAKLLTTAIVTLHPETHFTRTTLSRELIGRQGSNIQWKPSSRTGHGYCLKSLEPIGAVVKSAVKGYGGAIIDAFNASEFGVEYGLPCADTLLDWSLEYPDISVQKVFGVTATTGEVRSPSTRFLIYQAMLTGAEEGEGLTYGDITRSLQTYDLKPSVIEGQLDALAVLGIVEIQSKHKTYNPSIRIHSPDFPIKSVQPNTQTFYETAARFYAEGKYTVNLNDFLNLCQSMNPTADLPKLRHLFTMAIQQSNFPNMSLGDKGSLGDSQTSVELTDLYRQPIEELWDRLESVRVGVDLEKHREHARQIINNPRTFSLLMGKSKRFSSAVRGKDPHETPLPERILGILSNAGALSTRQVVEQLEEQGNQYNVGTVRAALNGLVKSNMAVKSQAILDPTKKTATDVFAVPDQPESP